MQPYWYNKVPATYHSWKGAWYPGYLAHKPYFVILLAWDLSPIIALSVKIQHLLRRIHLAACAGLHCWNMSVALGFHLNSSSWFVVSSEGSAKFLCRDLTQSSTMLESSTGPYAYTLWEAPPGTAGFMMTERPGQGQRLFSYIRI